MAAAERRLYAHFTLDVPESHKIAPLSDGAFRAWFNMIMWSRRNLTDGRIPASMARLLAKPRALSELMGNDPERPSLTRDEAGDYWLHDFLEHQPSRTQVEARQEQNRANGARGGLAKAKRTATKSASESLTEKEAKSYTETETETETTATDVAVRPRTRGTRIPEPFIVDADMRRWAAEEVPGLDVDRVTRKFVDYWRGKSGRDATKQDWLATWRNWLRTDFEARAAAPRGPASRPSKDDRAAETLRMGAEVQAALEERQQPVDPAFTLKGIPA